MKKTKTNSKKISREQAYLESINLRDWWEEFAHTHHNNGTLKFPTIWKFIQKKTKVKWQQDFLYWVLGPKVVLEKNQKPLYDAEQFDWAEAREKGFWYSSTNIENLSHEIKRRSTAFDRLQTAGSSLLEDLGRITELSRQIDREFGGRIMLPEAKASENRLRVELYMSLLSQITALKEKILMAYSRTQGVDAQKLEMFLQMFSQGMGSQIASTLGFSQTIEGGQSPAESSYRTVLNSITDMMLKKSADLSLPIPEGDTRKIVEQQVIQGKKKTQVQ